MIKIHIMQHSKRLIGEEEMKRGVGKVLIPQQAKFSYAQRD